ncbi:glucosamine-6-phosphate deaminase [Aristophania vespae]|uniref:Glucosamine-6-phosphate deaminase n=1 Tax=Aristophania vespae TaxID=2697033 RepID=A0A6P1NBP3_9PROT|nr:glucosamine-6-phosphate deaminase [Aristophania vespae]QHI96095.1 glucosamine-6-phosphate deaminase [Aristophania vespae]UMM63864.1 Glucosamine-6-phosphate deaminase 1 [Aristophania vespae]
MKVLIFPNATDAAHEAAKIIAKKVHEKPKSVLGLATGRTMEGVYRSLIQIAKQNNLDFSQVTSFNLDEYVGLSASDKQSYHYYMQDNLFRFVNINMNNTHVPNGVAADLEKECAAYEEAIKQAGGIDIQLLGIGDTGHIGFNEPPSAFDSRTRCITLASETRQQNAGMFEGNPQKVPSKALTMGVGTILEAKELLLIALGKDKAPIIARTLEGEIGPEVSATAVRLHKNVTIILDQDSASSLKQQ